jgi:hypothetical protein
MLKLFRQFDHFPGGVENGFVALLLPKLDVEIPAWKSVFYKPCFPDRLLGIFHI